MNDLQFHTPLKGNPKRHEFIAFDVEGVGGPNGFWCGATFARDGGKIHLNRSAMWNDLLDANNGQAWRVAHNLEYDLSVLAVEELLSGGATMGSSGLLWFDTPDANGQVIRFTDSLNLFRQMSVQKLGDLIGLPKLELPAGVLEAMRYGFPWAGWSSNEQAMILEYNMRDAEIVYRAMNWLQDIVNEMGGSLRETIAGTSHDLYRRVYMPHAWKTIGPATNESARLAFYGGRAEPFWMGINKGVNYYDANSLYPFVMRESRFPQPGYLDLEIPSGIPSDLDLREGVAFVTVSVPPLPIPPLPTRVNGALFFPIGEFTGAYCLNELRHAMECGVEIKQWHWMISTRKLFNPFPDFVNSLWDQRVIQAETNPERAEVIKLLLNSHIGRYGIKPDPPLTTLEIIRGKFDHVKDQGLIWDQIGRFDYIERPIGDDHRPTYANVFLAAQVAAGARVHLHKAMLSEGSRLLYVDTDSIMTSGELETGPELGAWKTVLEDGTANLIGPKEYAILYEHDRLLYHAKGVPAKLQREYIMTHKARWDAALSIRQARVSGRYPGSWVQTIKHQGSPTPKRLPVDDFPEEDGPIFTQAWDFPDLLDQKKTRSRVVR